jgi:rubrerythrin
VRTPELAAVEIHGMTRASFILRGALAAGAAYGAGAVGPYVSRAFAQTGQGDLEVLAFAIELEEIEAAFYDQAVKRAGLSGEVKELATTFGEHEKAHLDALTTTLEQLGGKAPPKSGVRFSVSGQEDFLRLAVALEDTGVGAYNGAVPALETPDIVAAAGTIVQTEARHAAALRFRAGEEPAPEAFERALTPQQAEAAVRRATGG